MSLVAARFAVGGWSYNGALIALADAMLDARVPERRSGTLMRRLGPPVGFAGWLTAPPDVAVVLWLRRPFSRDTKPARGCAENAGSEKAAACAGPGEFCAGRAISIVATFTPQWIARA